MHVAARGGSNSDVLQAPATSSRRARLCDVRLALRRFGATFTCWLCASSCRSDLGYSIAVRKRCVDWILDTVVEHLPLPVRTCLRTYYYDTPRVGMRMTQRGGTCRDPVPGSSCAIIGCACTHHSKTLSLGSRKRWLGERCEARSVPIGCTPPPLQS